MEFHHGHLELGALGYIETFLFYWSWVFFQNNPPPWLIFVFENTRDLKNIFFKNRLKSFFYQSHWIAFGLTIPKWYNTWVLKIFLDIFFEKIFWKIFEKYFWKKYLQKIFPIPKCYTILESWDQMQSNGFDRKMIWGDFKKMFFKSLFFSKTKIGLGGFFFWKKPHDQ